MNTILRRAGINDLRAVTTLTALLYGGRTEHYLSKENERLLESGDQAVFLAFAGEKAVGFAHCSIRRDYVEGTDGGPVGFLEGIYVVQEHRQKGIARALVRVCEDWARENGCRDFASDCELTNTNSLQFHMKIGFQEANRIICFTKRLPETDVR